MVMGGLRGTCWGRLGRAQGDHEGGHAGLPSSRCMTNTRFIIDHHVSALEHHQSQYGENVPLQWTGIRQLRVNTFLERHLHSMVHINS